MKKLKKIKALLLVLIISCSTTALFAQVSVGLNITANVAPPPLPVYTQPVIPGDGYLWTPGYWGYGDDGYYWVPGVWVRPPHFGVLWTPAYWGFAGGVYGFHAGYWGPHVGFYGGINYGFGYGGIGFGGGVWAGNSFRYNTAVSNINTTVVHNTYVNNTVINNRTVNRTSFNGTGGINARPNGEQEAASREQHIQPTSNQVEHQQNASHDRSQFASVNHGTPSTTAMNKVGGRAYNQQGRIANGMSNHSLTAGESKNLENRESSINKEARTDRAANGGRLNSQEKQQLNNRQNKVSNSIYNDKHNANNAADGNNRVGDRKANQQNRIANGVRNGQINANQAARDENRQQNLNRMARADRNANGGRLNNQQRQQVNRMQNHAGGQIRRQRH